MFGYRPCFFCCSSRRHHKDVLERCHRTSSQVLDPWCFKNKILPFAVHCGAVPVELHSQTTGLGQVILGPGKMGQWSFVKILLDRKVN